MPVWAGERKSDPDRGCGDAVSPSRKTKKKEWGTYGRGCIDMYMRWQCTAFYYYYLGLGNSIAFGWGLSSFFNKQAREGVQMANGEW